MERRDSSSSSLAQSGDNEDHQVLPINHHDFDQDHDHDEKQLPQDDNALKVSKTNNSTLSNKTLRRPRKERRGLLANVSLVPEFKDSREYPPLLKNFIVFIIAFAAMIGPMGTSIVFPAIEDMKHDLQTTTMKINISVGIYLLSLGIFPLWWSSFSERFGRRSIYIISSTLYLAFGIGCALSPSIESLIIFRVLSGGCSASVQAVGAGTISDLFATEHRGRALGIYYLGTLASPMLSPIIGSLLLIRWDWRSTQWFMVILAGFIEACIILFLPETLRLQDNKAFIAKILAERRMNKEHKDDEEVTVEQNGEEENDDDTNSEISAIEPDDLAIQRIASRISRVSGKSGNMDQADDVQLTTPDYYISTTAQVNPRAAEVRAHDLERLRTNIESALEEEQEPKTKWDIFKEGAYIYLFQPLKALNFLRYPPVALSISFSGISFGILYFVNMLIEYEFAREPYDWKSLYVGFAYIPNSTGYILASIYGGKWTDHLLKKFKEKHGFNAPESRISWNVFTAIVTYPISLLIMGWCFEYSTFWVTPLIGSALFGFASMMTIGPNVTYIVDSLPGRGATGVALNNFVRQIIATAAVFVTDPVLKGLGPGAACSMWAGVIVVSSVVLIIIKRKGTSWRENYDLQKLYDSLE